MIGEDAGGEPPVECSGTPMTVRVRLRTPMALYGWPWIAFDGLVAHIQLRSLDPDWYRTLPSLQGEPPRRTPREGMPLDRQGYVYAASVSMYEARALGRATIVKMPPADATVALATRRRRRVETASGELRRWLVGLLIVPTDTVVFHARGDPREVERLLRAVYNIGHKRAAGYGAIASIEVEESDVDRSVVDEHGRATRPIPLWMLSDYEKDKVYMGTYKPPYWDKRVVAPLAAPGSKVKLKNEYNCRR